MEIKIETELIIKQANLYRYICHLSNIATVLWKEVKTNKIIYLLSTREGQRLCSLCRKKGSNMEKQTATHTKNKTHRHQGSLIYCV